MEEVNAKEETSADNRQTATTTAMDRTIIFIVLCVCFFCFVFLGGDLLIDNDFD